MKKYLNSPSPSEAEDFGANWTAPCRGIQPPGFTIPHQHEEWPDARIVSAQEFARFSAEFIELRELMSEMRSEIKRALSQSKELRLRERKVRRTGQNMGQGVLPFLPKELRAISEAIENSRVSFNRQPDPSDDLSGVCSREAWERAMKILIGHALSVWEKLKLVIHPPVISPGPDGSVDLYWTAAPYGLLINVPADPKLPATYFGDDATSPDSTHTSGKLDPMKHIDVGALMWLAHIAEQ